MTTAAWSEPPELQCYCVAQTSGKRLIHCMMAGISGASVIATTLSNDIAGLPVLGGLITCGTRCVVIPDAPSGTAGYFETSPIVEFPDDIKPKINQALRKAESWGWSHVLSETHTIKAIDLTIPIINVTIQAGIAIPELPIAKGVIFLENYYVRNPLLEVEDLAWLIIHESLHQAMYSAGYAIDIYSYEPYSYLFIPVKFPPFLTHTIFRHHLGISLASVVNATTLGVNMDEISKWPIEPGSGKDVFQLSHFLPNPPESPTTPPDLRGKSVVQPVPDWFGARLDNMASHIANWGVGRWINQFGPLLNYPMSGIPATREHLVFDLTKTDVVLAWQIVKRAMTRTADDWAKAIPGVPPSAAEMGCIVLMTRLR